MSYGIYLACRKCLSCSCLTVAARGMLPGLCREVHAAGFSVVRRTVRCHNSRARRMLNKKLLPVLHIWVPIPLRSPLNDHPWKILPSVQSPRLASNLPQALNALSPPQPPDLWQLHLDDAGSSRVGRFEELARPHHGRGSSGEGYRRGHRGAAIGNGRPKSQARAVSQGQQRHR